MNWTDCRKLSRHNIYIQEIQVYNTLLCHFLQTSLRMWKKKYHCLKTGH